jgi:predicted ArsR family transcriptional regulator
MAFRLEHAISFSTVRSGTTDFDEGVAGISSLAEPQRRALYRFVVAQVRSVSKDEAAEALGLARSVAGFHLDRLVADGLLTTEFRRLTGRQGPGAGRPAKLYRRAAGELSVSLPPRHYDLAAELLADAVNQSITAGSPVSEELRTVANQRGREFGSQARQAAGKRPSRRALVKSAMTALEEHGYEPRSDGGEIVLENCPFHALADQQRELVCGMNHDLLAGMADGLGDGVLTARLEPSDDHCCVRLATGGRADRPSSA